MHLIPLNWSRQISKYIHILKENVAQRSCKNNVMTAKEFSERGP